MTDLMAYRRPSSPTAREELAELDARLEELVQDGREREQHGLDDDAVLLAVERREVAQDVLGPERLAGVDHRGRECFEADEELVAPDGRELVLEVGCGILGEAEGEHVERIRDGASVNVEVERSCRGGRASGALDSTRRREFERRTCGEVEEGVDVAREAVSQGAQALLALERVAGDFLGRPGPFAELARVLSLRGSLGRLAARFGSTASEVVESSYMGGCDDGAGDEAGVGEAGAGAEGRGRRVVEGRTSGRRKAAWWVLEPAWERIRDGLSCFERLLLVGQTVHWYQMRLPQRWRAKPAGARGRRRRRGSAGGWSA